MDAVENGAHTVERMTFNFKSHTNEIGDESIF